MNTSLLLFPAGARLSTWAAGAAFIILAAHRRDWKVLVAGWVWLSGFEAVFQGTSLAEGRLPYGPAAAVIFLLPGLVAVPWFWLQGIRPALPLVALFVLVWIAWVAAGFPVNGHTTVGFSAEAEAFNEAAKMLLAAAYLIPFLTSRRPALPAAGMEVS